jgi:chaperonin cofactor prefoldin
MLKKIALSFMLIGWSLLAQTTAQSQLKTELEDLSTTLERLRRQQQVLFVQADSLAKDIQRRKQQAPSLLQARGLDGALRFSQTLADSLQSLQGREQRFDFALRQKAEALLKILKDDIGRLVKEDAAFKRSNNAGQREQVARELMQCREWQRRCQEWLEQPPPAIIIYQVEAQPDDAPETLRHKADFLRDQADRLQRDVKRLDNKITGIREEVQVRQRLADLATDLTLLDPNLEGVISASPNQGASPTGLEAGINRGNDAAFSNLSNSSLTASQNWPVQLGELSFRELERWQKKLEQQKKQRQSQADSLTQRALEIEKLMDKPGKPAVEKRP